MRRHGQSRRGRAMTLSAALVAVATAFSAALPAAGQAYRVVDVTPPGYTILTFGGAGGGQAVGSGIAPGEQFTRPLLWTDATKPQVVQLNPPGFGVGYAYDADGVRQVGTAAGGGVGQGYQALLWNGSPGSYVNLTPPGTNNAFAAAIDGDRQFGWARPNNATLDRAMAWSGTAASALDINPPGFGYSHALGAGDGQAVGLARRNNNVGEAAHPMLWSGPSLAPTDLLPAGYAEAIAYDADGGRQVGIGFKVVEGVDYHALLWSGTAASAVSLHPLSGFRSSWASAIEGDTQVGHGVVANFTERALLWRGSAESVVNLHALLPAGYTASSAGDVDTAGNVYGWARDAAGVQRAVIWTVVPEPASAVSLLAPASCLLLRQRRATFVASAGRI